MHDSCTISPFGPMEFPIKFDTVKSGCGPLYIWRGHRLSPSYTFTILAMVARFIMVNREPPGQGYDEFKPFKLLGVIRVGLWAWPKS